MILIENSLWLGSANTQFKPFTCSSWHIFWCRSTFIASISCRIRGRSSPNIFLSIIFMATFSPVTECVASFTLAKPPVPIVSCNSYCPSRAEYAWYCLQWQGINSWIPLFFKAYYLFTENFMISWYFYIITYLIVVHFDPRWGLDWCWYSKTLVLIALSAIGTAIAGIAVAIVSTGILIGNSTWVTNQRITH